MSGLTEAERESLVMALLCDADQVTTEAQALSVANWVEAIIAARESAAVEAFRAKAVAAIDSEVVDCCKGCDSCDGHFRHGLNHGAFVIQHLTT